MVLTKNEILKGINNIQKINIKSLGGEVYLRPLSETELKEVEMVEAKGMGVFESTQKGRREAMNKGKIDLVKATDATYNSKLTKIQVSINNDKNPDKWTLDEIGELPRNAINELIEKIDELSGIETTKQEVDTFPEE